MVRPSVEQFAVYRCQEMAVLVSSLTEALNFLSSQLDLTVKGNGHTIREGGNPVRFVLSPF